MIQLLLQTDFQSPASVRLAIDAINANPHLVSDASKDEVKRWVTKLAHLVASSSPTSESDHFLAAAFTRLTAIHVSEEIFGLHAVAWANSLLALSKRYASSGLVLSECLLSLRSVIIRSRISDQLQRYVTTNIIPKLFNWLFQRLSTLTDDELVNSEISACALREFYVLANTFASQFKLFSEKMEEICLKVITKGGCGPKVQYLALKVLVQVGKLASSNTTKKKTSETGKLVHGKSLKASTSLLEVARDIVSLGRSVTGSEIGLLPSVEGTYSVALSLNVERFKLLVRYHLHLFSFRVDNVSPDVLFEVADVILDGFKVKGGESISASLLLSVMPVLVGWTHKLLSSLLRALSLNLLPLRDVIANLARKSFGCSIQYPSMKGSLYELITTFLEVFGFSGADSLTSSIAADAASDINLWDSGSPDKIPLQIASAKFLRTAFQLGGPAFMRTTERKKLFSSCVRALLSYKVARLSRQWANAICPSVIFAFAELVIAILQRRDRDEFPFEWIAAGMHALIQCAPVAPAKLQFKLYALISDHSDTMFGYVPVLRLESSVAREKERDSQGPSIFSMKEVRLRTNENKNAAFIQDSGMDVDETSSASKSHLPSGPSGLHRQDSPDNAPPPPPLNTGKHPVANFFVSTSKETGAAESTDSISEPSTRAWAPLKRNANVTDATDEAETYAVKRKIAALSDVGEEDGDLPEINIDDIEEEDSGGDDD